MERCATGASGVRPPGDGKGAPREAGAGRLRHVIHRVNNLAATLLAESELALESGDASAREAALRKVVERVSALRDFLRAVAREAVRDDGD